MAQKHAVRLARPVKALPFWHVFFAGQRVGQVRRAGSHGYLARCEGHDIGGQNIPSLRAFGTLAEAKKTIQRRLNGCGEP